MPVAAADPLPVDTATDVFAKQEWQLGTSEAVAKSVSGNVAGVAMFYDSLKQQPGTIVRLEVFASVDGGVTWMSNGAADFGGDQVPADIIKAGGDGKPGFAAYVALKDAQFKQRLTLIGTKLDTSAQFKALSHK